MAKNEDHIWKKIFIELAVRAIRKKHLDFQIVNQGQHGLQIENLDKLNTGIGIELVPEESVRDEIINQLLESGLWKDTKIDEKTRAYWCDRETFVKLEKKKLNEIDNFEKEKRKCIFISI